MIVVPLSKRNNSFNRNFTAASCRLKLIKAKKRDFGFTSVPTIVTNHKYFFPRNSQEKIVFERVWILKGEGSTYKRIRGPQNRSQDPKICPKMRATVFGLCRTKTKND